MVVFIRIGPLQNPKTLGKGPGVLDRSRTLLEASTTDPLDPYETLKNFLNPYAQTPPKPTPNQQKSEMRVRPFSDSP